MKLENLSYIRGGSVYSHFDYLAAEADQDPMYRLLKYLETLDGPDLRINSSHSYFFFSTADGIILAYAYAIRDAGWYCIEYPIPCEWMPQLPPGSQLEFLIPKTSVYVKGIKMAGQALLSAFEASGNNPARTSADWMWYVCPRCDFHQVQYAERCERCDHPFPPETKLQAIGALRVAHTPSDRADE
ncbi:MAG: hypothetical protein CME32_23615 [Gimesia sp.]|nr:hypothetical protein [Gimesia sp.]